MSTAFSRNFYQFQGISCYQFFRKTRENLQQKGLQNQFVGISLELFPRFSQEFLRNILKYSLTKVVNNLTTILPLQLFRSITIFFSQNVIVVYDLTEVVMYFDYSDKRIKNKKNVLKFLNIFLKDGSDVNYHFLSIRIQRKKDLV